ncbi:MAG: phosphohistidine phosphatase SixA [Leptospiraceae bacterium]|nr:phosphohistidine phosphatase SixA [Leptospiraceae bacterium]MDW7976305.1 phosphohistidine phosphatase SixA [Leptospiraceae bacterium]
MKLVLIRHCKAYESYEDPERRLNEQGIQEAKIVARLLKKTNWKFKEILTSPILRAVQTCEVFNQEFHLPIVQRVELKPNNALVYFDSLLASYHANDAIIIVFHMPDVAEIAARILKLPSNNLYVSTGGMIGINLTNIQRLEGILVFMYQPELLD